jgi:hypothetical protein
METPPAAAAAAPLPPLACLRMPSYNVPRIFGDFCCRRAALIRALTTGEKTLSVLPVLALWI